MAEQIEMSLGVWTWVGPKNHTIIIHLVQIPVHARSILRVKRSRPRTSGGRYA